MKGRAINGPHVHALLFCEKVIVDHPSFQRSLIGTYDEVRAARFPFVLPTITFYLLIERGADIPLIRFHFVTAGGEQLIEGTMHRDVWPESGLGEFHVTTQNVRIPAPGPCTLIISIDGEVLAQRTMEFRLTA